MTTLIHKVRTPKKNTPNPPLLVLLHGYGSNEEDLFSFSNYLPDHFLIVSFQAPISLQPYGYAWYAINFEAEQGRWSDPKEGISARDLILNAIENLNTSYRFDSNNIHLLGFSQGGVLSYALALSYPGLFKSATILSGYIFSEIMDIKSSGYDKLHIYASHGTQDQVVPFEWGKQSTKLLDKIGVHYQFESFEAGHTVTSENFYSFLSWLNNR